MVTPTVLNKSTASLLEMACESAPMLGAGAVVVLPEGPMDWHAVKAIAGLVRLMIATPINPASMAASR